MQEPSGFQRTTEATSEKVTRDLNYINRPWGMLPVTDFVASEAGHRRGALAHACVPRVLFWAPGWHSPVCRTQRCSWTML